MAGYRGLLAPWIGGASSSPATQGFKGLLAPWIGGAASPSSGEQGFRGMLAPWIGGASSPASSNAGYRGLLAFWAGGASTGFIPPPEPDNPIAFGPPRFRFHVRPNYREDEEILVIISAFLQMINR